MKFPCEIIAEPYMAQIRIVAAKFLANQGFNQSQIARLLQVSQPVVSGYLKKQGQFTEVPDNIVLKAEEVGKKVGKLLEMRGKDGIPEAISLGCRECKILRQRGPTCIYHEQKMELPSDCSLCLTPENLIQLQQDKESILFELRELYRFLSRKKYINKLIPEIGLQIVYGTEDMDSIFDIAGFPGRIIKRKSSNPLADPPTFGSSETTSHLLLRIRERDNKVRSIAGMKTSNYLKNQLDKFDISYKSTKEFDTSYEDKIDEIFISKTSLPFFIMNQGSFGFEPISYLIAEDLDQMKYIIGLFS